MPLVIDDNGTVLLLGDLIVLGVDDTDLLPDDDAAVAAADGILATIGLPGAPRLPLAADLPFRCDLGSTVELVATFGRAGHTADPTTVELRILTPGMDEAAATTVWAGAAHPATGVYVHRFVCTEQGRFSWWWQATGIDAADTGGWDVAPSPWVWQAP